MKKDGFSPTLARALLGKKPDYFGFSVYSEDVPRSARVVDMVKELVPDIKVFVGGPAAILSPIHMLVHMGGGDDIYVYPGEADFSFTEALDACANLPDEERRERLRELGFYFVEAGRIYRPNLPDVPRISKEELQNVRLDWGVIGDWGMFTFSKDRKPSIEINTSRGCRFMCPYCSKTGGDVHRAWSADRIMDEIGNIHSNHERGFLPPNISILAFTDDDFYQQRARSLEFLGKFRGHPVYPKEYALLTMGSPASFYTTGSFDEQLFKAIKEVPKIGVAFGAEHLSEQGLKDLGQPHSLAQIKEIMNRFTEAGIDQLYFLILANHETTPRTLLELGKNLLEIAADPEKNSKIRFMITPYEKIYPGTRFEERAKRGGFYEKGVVDSRQVFTRLRPPLNVYQVLHLEPQDPVANAVMKDVEQAIDDYGEFHQMQAIPLTLLESLKDYGERAIQENAGDDAYRQELAQIIEEIDQLEPVTERLKPLWIQKE
ncbi:MAG: radical SAM protein [Methanobacteriota archaeon]